MAAKKQPVKGVWSVYDSTLKAIATFDTFLDYDAEEASKITSMLVEGGSFAGYNKVASPFTVDVRLARSGSPDELARFVAELEKFAGSTQLVSVVTPHKIYLSANIEGFKHSMKRENGVSMLVAELSLVEIRQVATAYKTVKRAGHKKPEDKGLVQAKPPRRSLAEAGYRSAEQKFKQLKAMWS